MTKKVFIVGLTPQGLSLLRVFSRAGVEVIAFCNNKRNVGYHSRYGRKVLFDGVDDLKMKIAAELNSLDYNPLCYITSGELLAMVLRDFKELSDLC